MKSENGIARVASAETGASWNRGQEDIIHATATAISWSRIKLPSQIGRFQYCPSDSPYLPAVRKYFGKGDDWLPVDSLSLSRAMYDVKSLLV